MNPCRPFIAQPASCSLLCSRSDSLPAATITLRPGLMTATTMAAVAPRCRMRAAASPDSGGGQPDGGGGDKDAGDRPDAGDVDGGSDRDAGDVPDAGDRDGGGAPDAGDPDAGTPDAGEPDAGPDPFDGEFLLGIRANALPDPTHPPRFIARGLHGDRRGCGWRGDFTFQPIIADDCVANMGGLPVGDRDRRSTDVPSQPKARSRCRSASTASRARERHHAHGMPGSVDAIDVTRARFRART